MKRLKILPVILLGLFILTAESSNDLTNQPIEVMAHYCPWYEIPWVWHAYTMPLRGFYNSWDPIVAAAQNEEKNKYGVGIDMISWAGPGHSQETWALAGYFRAHNFTSRKFCILYEILDDYLLGERDYYDFSDPALAERFLYHIDYLVQTFGWHPNWYKIDDRPLVYIWTGKFKNFKETAEEARKKVYLVGPELILSPPDDSDQERIENLKCWDAITSYGIDPVRLAQKYGSLNINAIEEYVRAVVKWDRILRLYAPKTELILPLQFAYHDNRGDVDINGKTRILTSTPEQAEMFAKTVKYLCDATGRRKIFVVSYNEHYEGTGIESSVEYGDFWLSLIKKYFTDSNEKEFNKDKIK